MDAPSITCPRCLRTSYSPGDIENLYCGFCNWWTSDPQLGAPEVIAEAEAKGKLAAIDAPVLEFLHGNPYWSGEHLDKLVEGAFLVGLVLGVSIGLVALALYAAGL